MIGIISTAPAAARAVVLVLFALAGVDAGGAISYFFGDSGDISAVIALPSCVSGDRGGRISA